MSVLNQTASLKSSKEPGTGPSKTRTILMGILGVIGRIMALLSGDPLVSAGCPASDFHIGASLGLDPARDFGSRIDHPSIPS